MDKDITNIASRFYTDKNEHGYIPYYQKHLPDKATRILEIGVYKGESIKMWQEIYPDAKVFGLDLFEEFPKPDNDSAIFFKGSQADGALLDSVRQFGPFDFIVDDGSHNSRDQWISFWGLIGCCKMYVIEDMYSDEFWRGGLPENLTILSQMQQNKFPLTYDLYMDKIAFICP